MLCAQQLYAQNRTVSGVVTAKEDGAPLPGVSVKVRGANIGTQTGIDGRYTLSVPSSATFLDFSFIGYSSVAMPIKGGAVNAVLTISASQLGEVVVTANNVKREKRTLGYATQSVGSKELTMGGSASPLSSLAGKVAGLNVTSTSNTPGSSTRIVLRGGTSIAGNNQPLMVIDGVPVDNSSIIGGASSLTAVDFGNRGNDVDPADIDNISILEGPAAAARYGARAANGAIMITTKSGKNGKTEITLNSNNTFSSILKLPDWQNEYGQGYMSTSNNNSVADFTTGIDDGSDNWSWGGPFTGKVAPWGQTIAGVVQSKPYSALPNNVKDFFSTGFSTENNLGISSGTDRGSFYLALNSLNSNGIMPSNKDLFQKYGVRFNGNTKFSDKFTAGINFNYSKISSSNIANGQNANGLWENLLQTPRDIPVDKMSDLNNPYNAYGFTDSKGVIRSKQYGYYNAFALNPYWVIQNFSNLDNVSHVTGSFDLNYKPVKWINVEERLGIDTYNDRRRLLVPKYSYTAADESANSALWTGAGALSNNGSYEIDQFNVSELNHDLMVTITHDFSKDFKTLLLLGNNIRQRNTNSNLTSTNTSGGLVVPGWYNLQNSNGPVNVITDAQTIKRQVGFYADLTLTYKDFLTLEGSIRNDRSSTLPKNNYSYYYPSVNGAFVFTDLLKDSGISNILSYGKLRASWAKVGSDTDPYQLFTTFSKGTINGAFGSTTFPFGNVAALQAGSTIGNNTLKPEQTTGYEFGTELNFLADRITFAFTYYVNDTKDQILSIPIPNSTGYGFNVVNAGEKRNQGIQLYASGMLIKTRDFGVKLNANFTKNNSKIVALPAGVSQIVIGGFNGMSIVAAKGHPYGEFYAVADSKDAQGRTIINKSTGLPIPTTTAQYLGTYDPKFQAGWGAEFTYSNFTLDAQFSMKHGGVLYSQTKDLSAFVGTSAETGGPRYGQPFPNSVYLDASGNSVPNTSIFYSKQDYYTDLQPGQNIVDASYVKLQSASLSYTLNKRQLKSLPFTNLTVGVFGNNLFLWTPKSNKYVDPEVNASGAGNEQGFDFAALPSVRNYGINLKVTF